MAYAGDQTGQKRSSETPAQDLGLARPSTKKPRFDHRNPMVLVRDASDDESDSILDLDVIGRKTKKQKGVIVNGYESDSEHETFDARVARLAKEKSTAAKKVRVNGISNERGGSDDGGDNGLDQDGGRKKDVRFLDLEEIEGQDMNKLERDTDSSSDGATDDEGRARIDSDMDEEVGAGGKKHHAPRLEAFNMKAEYEEGRFDENMNYVRKAVDPDAEHDSWLKGLSKREIKRAARMHELREEEMREREAAEEAVPTSQHLAALITHLRKGETVLEGLQRRNKTKQPRKTKRGKQNKSADAVAGGEPSTEEVKAEKERVAAIEAISEAADKLSYRGLPGVSDIYDTERELLIRHYKRETGTDWVDTGKSADTQLWEFRWVDGRYGGGANGPYTPDQLKEWRDDGFFDEGVEYRPVGDVEWMKTADF